MILSGKARLGRDAVLRDSGGNGGKVANMTMAFDYGRAANGERRPVQWVEASLWGKRAEALEKYLVKGRELFVVIKDPHIETFTRQDDTVGYKLAGEIIEIELGQAPQTTAPAAPAPAPRPAPAPAPRPSSVDDDIPF